MASSVHIDWSQEDGMYIRILWGRLRSGVWDEYARYYSRQIEPITREMEGFRGRQLLRSVGTSDECVSVAVWDTFTAMQSYSRSQQRLEAVHGIEHLYTSEYWVHNFEIRSSTVQYPSSGFPYVRMLWGSLRLGRWDEYERYYNDHIEPVTQEMRGFRGRQLLRSVENSDEGISITLWDTLDSMQRYDMSPHRQEAASGIQHLYTGDFWVRKLEIKSSTIG